MIPAAPLNETLQLLSSHVDYVNLRDIPGVLIELKYATQDNFMGKDVYGELKEAFLHRTAAEMLARAVENLETSHPGYRLLVFDALRPRSVQRILWAHVEGTDQEGYVANPEKGSVHNFGFAVDLTVLDASGRELDMGTPFDTFQPLSQPKLEDEFLAMGRLTPEQLRNRFILRNAMTSAGFLQLPHEWWHYDALPGTEVRAKFQIIE